MPKKADPGDSPGFRVGGGLTTDNFLAPSAIVPFLGWWVHETPKSKVVGDLQRLGMKFGHELNHMVDTCWTSWCYRCVFFQVIFSEILSRPFLLLHPYVERVCMHQCDILWMCFFGESLLSHSTMLYCLFMIEFPHFRGDICCYWNNFNNYFSSSSQKLWPQQIISG